MERITVLVNGGASSAAGVRARALVGALGPPNEARILYRRLPRPLGALAFFLGLWRQAPTICYLMDLGIAGATAALAYRRLRPLRVVVDTGDAVAELGAFLGRSWPLQRLTQWMERAVWKIADLAIVRGEYHQRQLRSRGVRRIEVIPDGVDTALFAPRDAENLRRALGLEGMVTIGIQGTFAWNRRLGWGLGHELVEALAHLKDLPVRGILIGDGNGLRRLKRRARALKVEGMIRWVGRVPYEKLPEYLNAVDVCLLTQTNEATSWVRTTGKLPCYMACGRYILASRVGTPALVLPQEMLIHYEGAYDPMYPQRVAQRLRALVQNPRQLSKGRALVPMAQDRFDYRALATELGRALAALDGQARPRRQQAVAFVTPEPLAFRGGIQVLLGCLAQEWASREAIEVLAPRERVGGPRFLWAAQRQLEDLIRRGRCRLVFCGHWTVGLLGWWAWRRHRVPYTIWAHGLEVTDSRWHALQRRVFAHAARVFASSAYTKEMVHRRFGIPDERVVTVWPGVDVERFHAGNPHAVRQRWTLEPSAVLLSVGRLNRLQRYKGMDTMLRALPAVVEQKPQTTYLIVGQPEDDSAYLRSLAAALGVSRHVRFVGEVPAAALPDYYAACDLFVLPTRTEVARRGIRAEGFGIAFLEAAAAGKPALGGRSGGVPEAVSDGVSGLLVEPTDPHALAEAILRLFSDGELTRRLGTQAFARAAREFTWGRVLGQVQAQLERVAP